MHPEPVEIFVSKFKTSLLLLGAVVFVLLGVLISTDPEKFANNRYDPTFVFIISVVCIVFFSACAVVGAIKLFQKRPAYIINDQGIVLDTRKPEVAVVRWDEIDEFMLMEIRSTKTILVKLTVPENFMARQPEGFKKKMMNISLRNYQSPISISASSLKIKHNHLWDTLIKYHAFHRQKV